jgi:hypothetical protein
MLSFERFLQAYMGDKYSHHNLNATIIELDNIRFNAYHYYIREYKRGYFEIMINQVDDWSSNQGSAINNAKKIVNSIASDKKIHDFKNIKFTIITREGIKNESFEDMVSNKTQKSLAKFERHIISNFTDIQDNPDFLEDKYIFLDIDILYNSLSYCHRDLVMIQLFLNSLKKKFDLKSDNQKDIYRFYDLSEQTFYNWKKKNPKLFDSIVDGYFYKDIKEIVSCLSSMQNLMSENWSNYEPMRDLDKSEF